MCIWGIENGVKYGETENDVERHGRSALAVNST